MEQNIDWCKIKHIGDIARHGINNDNNTITRRLVLMSSPWIKSTKLLNLMMKGTTCTSAHASSPRESNH